MALCPEIYPHQEYFTLFHGKLTQPTISIPMAPIPSGQKKNLGKVLVIGGCGFLGHHIVDLLLESYKSSIYVLDLHTTRNRRPDSDGVQYFDGDITDLSSILPTFEKIKPDVVIHTASPAAIGESSEQKTKIRNAMYKKVNIDGTHCVIEACQKTNVKALVYTSSASVISDTETDLINADERWPVIPAKNQKEYYSTTKVSHSLPKFPQDISLTNSSRQ
jgi:sterol-4alpha-carboxylate 3-dehydrogenase (decarboxylating)